MTDSSSPNYSASSAPYSGKTSKTRPRSLTRRLTGALIKDNRSGIRSSNVDQGIGHGTEMALTLAVFMGIGWFLDKWLETSPIFIISLVIISAVAQFLKLYFVYTHHMGELERERAQRSQGEL